MWSSVWRSEQGGEKDKDVWELVEWSRRSWARERASAVGRSDTASPWRFDGGPRRARTGWRRVARLRCFRRTRNGAEGRGSARGRRRRRAAANGAGTASRPKQREEME